MRRIVVTGVGAVTPLAHSAEATWHAVLNSQSGIQSYLNDPVLHNTQPFNLALVNNFDFSKWKVPHAPSRLTSFLAKATSEAIENSRIDLSKIDLHRAGICLGSLASSTTKLLSHIEESQKDGFKTVNRLSMLQVLTNIPAATLNVLHKFRGPSLTVSSACASGLSAIVQGFKWIRLNEADMVIVGASQDVYNPLYLYSSLRLQAMSSKQYAQPGQSSRPFDKQRSGFILGEGSGVLIIEELQHALKRGAPIIAQILGYGYTSDGFHLVRPESSGLGQINAMKKAIEMSNLKASDIDHINVHATSTEAGDEIEAKSIKSTFGERPTVSALKSYFGHTFAAAGAIQTILGLMSIRDSIAPRILNLESSDVQGVNYALEHTPQEIRYMVKNSFGFGGINVSAVFKKY